MSFPNHLKGKARVDKGREWGKRSAANRKPSDLDFETIRMRALHDAKGTIIRQGCTYTSDGETDWQMRRAVHGRVNQVELVVGGEIRATGSHRKAARSAREGVWAA